MLILPMAKKEKRKLKWQVYTVKLSLEKCPAGKPRGDEIPEGYPTATENARQ